MVAAAEYVPFWMTFELSIGTIGYAFALAVLAALIVGVLPGLKTTGRRLLTPLRALGGSTGMQLGATWTTLIVAQVAVAVGRLAGGRFRRVRSRAHGDLRTGVSGGAVRDCQG